MLNFLAGVFYVTIAFLLILIVLGIAGINAIIDYIPGIMITVCIVIYSAIVFVVIDALLKNIRSRKQSPKYFSVYKMITCVSSHAIILYESANFFLILARDAVSIVNLADFFSYIVTILVCGSAITYPFLIWSKMHLEYEEHFYLYYILHVILFLIMRLYIPILWVF